ncbi:unnamed protein product [Onchocerca flexuosa]|uniref:Transmembrane protein n=1 Tax=Onchocerca flexuosa TaxID=387005 RepID=A0A183HJ77_9BILA|nr:unnamed protein product [Onchocerca flexuosa]
MNKQSGERHYFMQFKSDYTMGYEIWNVLQGNSEHQSTHWLSFMSYLLFRSQLMRKDLAKINHNQYYNDYCEMEHRVITNNHLQHIKMNQTSELNNVLNDDDEQEWHDAYDSTPENVRKSSLILVRIFVCLK